jgi:hypothetical protein
VWQSKLLWRHLVLHCLRHQLLLRSRYISWRWVCGIGSMIVIRLYVLVRRITIPYLLRTKFGGTLFWVSFNSRGLFKIIIEHDAWKYCPSRVWSAVSSGSGMVALVLSVFGGSTCVKMIGDERWEGVVRMAFYGAFFVTRIWQLTLWASWLLILGHHVQYCGISRTYILYRTL